MLYISIMKKIEAIIKPFKLDEVKEALSKIGINGIIGFSSKPLFLMTIAGFIIAFLSFMFGIWYFIQKITGVITLPGLSTIVILVSFYSGIQLLGMGILGEYIGRIYEEVKQRPKYILDKKINFENNKDQ